MKVDCTLFDMAVLEKLKNSMRELPTLTKIHVNQSIGKYKLKLVVHDRGKMTATNKQNHHGLLFSIKS